MRILILEDDSKRVNTFIEKYHNHDLTINESALEVVKLLEDNVYDVLFLDHDLGDVSNGTGTYVSSYLRMHPENLNNEADIFIHSWNVPGSMNMQQDLPQATWVPFNSDEFYSLD